MSKIQDSAIGFCTGIASGVIGLLGTFPYVHLVGECVNIGNQLLAEAGSRFFFLPKEEIIDHFVTPFASIMGGYQVFLAAGAFAVCYYNPEWSNRFNLQNVSEAYQQGAVLTIIRRNLPFLFKYF